VEQFYRLEARARKRHFYPPFCGMFTLLMSDSDRFHLLQLAQKIGGFLQRKIPTGFAQVLGPVPATIPKLKDRYRMQIILKHKLESEIYQAIHHVLQQVAQMVWQHPNFRLQIRKEGHFLGKE
jgi:primosomal protein N' (replication factor Y)